MSSKQQYRIHNWHDYNESLVNRGSIQIWLDEESIKEWHAVKLTGQAGRPALYSNAAIQCALIIRSVYNLAFRATEGFLKSLIELGKLPIKCPDYTTLCRRQKQLHVELPVSASVLESDLIHLVIDSTGLKIFGEGEWKVRQHGYSKRCTWRKLHIAVDVNSQEIVSAALTTNDFKDSEVLEDLLDDISSLEKVSADGAYDSHEIYEMINALGARPNIPPRVDAVIKQHGNCKTPPLARDQTIREIRKCGRKAWKKQSGYHKRSLSETAMFRIKTIFGNFLRSRVFENQGVEGLLKCCALNMMTQLGMPESYKVI